MLADPLAANWPPAGCARVGAPATAAAIHCYREPCQSARVGNSPVNFLKTSSPETCILARETISQGLNFYFCLVPNDSLCFYFVLFLNKPSVPTREGTFGEVSGPFQVLCLILHTLNFISVLLGKHADV